MKRALREVQHHRAVLADGIQHHRILGLRNYLADDVNALGLEPLQPGEHHPPVKRVRRAQARPGEGDG